MNIIIHVGRVADELVAPEDQSSGEDELFVGVGGWVGGWVDRGREGGLNGVLHAGVGWVGGRLTWRRKRRVENAHVAP